MANTTLSVDREFRSLIPPLRPDEREKLEESLKADGCRDPLVTWQGALLDGHNRHDICERLGIKFQVREVVLADRLEALIWIRTNQSARRNLSDDQRAMNAAALAELIGEREKRARAINARQAVKERNPVKPDLSDTVSDKSEPKPSKSPVAIPAKPAPAPPKKDTRAAVSKSAGVSERKVKDAQEVRKKAPELAARVESGEIKLKDASREIRRVEKQAVREEAAKEAEKIVAADDYGVRAGDFREVAKSVADNSVDLIFTDPPYDRKTLPLYGDMAEIAARILKPGGSLICYLGQYQLGDVCNLVSPHLRLWWTLACAHTGKSARMNEYGVVVKWKPMLWFVKGTRGDKQTFVDDLIDSRMEKGAHDWQQSVVEASYYIDKLTLPGGLVFDPFCGGGTTAVAAQQLKRRWLTCDLDDVAVKLARKRLHDLPRDPIPLGLAG